MNYIDLLSDSDDDIPLIPTAQYLNRSKTGNSSVKPTTFKPPTNSIKATTSNEGDAVDLLTSSDDDEPILKRPCIKNETPITDTNNHNGGQLSSEVISLGDYASDQTDKYSDDVLSDHTEKYGGSDKDSLPDISLVNDPPPHDDLTDFDYGRDYNPKVDNTYQISNDVQEVHNLESLPHTHKQPTSICDINGASCNPMSRHIEVAPLPQLRKPTKPQSSASYDDDYTSIKPPSVVGNAANVRAQKAAEKAAERDRKRVEKEQTQQKKREEKEKAALEKQRDIAMRNAEREARRAAQPGECHRHMVLEVDRRFEKKRLGMCIEASCVAHCVPMKYVDSLMANTVVYKRKRPNTQTGTSDLIQEDSMAVIIPMEDMVDMVLASVNATNTHLSLEAYIQRVQEIYNSQVTLIVLSVEKYFRTVKTQTNRVYRDNVLGTQNNSKKNKEISLITRLQYEETVTALQMSTNTVIINQELEEDVAKTILRMNKSIAEAPVKRDKYEQQALTVRTTGLKIGKDFQGSRQVWQRMLQEFRNISADVAAAIVNQWPSPYMLLKEYQRSPSTQHAELLLQDIEIRRGGGVVQTTRRVGKETSRRVYELFTKEADFIIR